MPRKREQRAITTNKRCKCGAYVRGLAFIDCVRCAELKRKAAYRFEYDRRVRNHKNAQARLYYQLNRERIRARYHARNKLHKSNGQ